MPEKSRPRKGSLGFGPRKRATSEVPRFRSWPADDGQSQVQGFAGYKAGMSHVVMINDESDSPREGMEETVPVTILETPPVRAVALRAYENTPYGKKPLTEVWTDEFHGELDRVLDLPDGAVGDEEQLREAVETGDVADLRLITHTVPDAVPSVPKKKPDVMETRVGGTDPPAVEPDAPGRFDLWIDAIPNQGSETVRTEEAMFAALACLTLTE